MENSVVVDAKQFAQLLQDVALIKQRLNEVLEIRSNDIDDEGELTDWAKRELAEARAEPDSELVSSEDVKQMILGNEPWC